MSKRSINIDDIMSRAQKKRQISYDILNEGSKIVQKESPVPEIKIEQKAGASIDKEAKSHEKSMTGAESRILEPKSKIKKNSQFKTQEIQESDAPSVKDFKNFPAVDSEVNGPQLSRNSSSSAISNFVFTSAKSSLSSREYKVLLCLLAETQFGSKDTVELSLERMGEVSGIYKGHVSGVIKSLVERGAILKIRSDNGRSNQYGLNLNYLGS